MSLSKTSNKNEELLRTLRHQLRDSPKKTRVLAKARASLPILAFDQAIEWIQGNKAVKDRVFPAQFPKQPGLLNRFIGPAPVSLDRELRWAAAYLIPHADRLREFVDLASKFEEHVLDSDHDHSSAVLDEIERRLGTSLWLIRNRIVLLQLKQGLESQKEYVAQLRSAARPRSVMAFIAFYVSARSEANVTFNRFSSQMDKRFAEATFPSHLRAFLRYHILADPPRNSAEVADILSIGLVGSVVDYFEMLLFTIRLLIVRDTREALPHAALALDRLGEAIPSPRIEILRFQVTSGASTVLPTIPAEPFEHFLKGEPEQALARLSSIKNREQFDLLETKALAVAALDRPELPETTSLATSVVRQMVDLLTRAANTDDLVDSLMKIAVTYSGQAWADTLGAFALREKRLLLTAPSDERIQLGAIGVPFIHPLRLGYLPVGRLRGGQEKLIRQAYGSNSLLTKYANVIANDEAPTELRTSLGAVEGAIVTARWQYREGKYEEAIATLEGFRNTPSAYYRAHALAITASSLLQLRRYGECLPLLVDAIVDNREFRHVLPVEQLAAAVASDIGVANERDISVPILFDIAARYVDDEFESLRRDSFENYLDGVDVDRPNALVHVDPPSNIKRLVYFLRYVCVPQVLDTSLICTSSEDVAQERLAVCRTLIGLDEKNAEIYQEEIKNILRDLTLRKRLREVERSKVYVDIDGIKRTAGDTLRESFERYISFVKHGLTTATSSEIESALAKAQKGEVEDLQSLALPKNEATELLQTLIEDILELFVSSPEFGLDRFLSMRIRHGTLLGHLRNPLREHDLITQRDSVSRAYARNEYWIERLGIGDAKVQNAVTNRFGAFAREFDGLVEMILKNWLRVKTRPEDPGLFGFSVDAEAVRVLAGLIKSETTFEEFLNAVLASFTVTLDKSLEVVRDKIASDAKPKANDMLTSLQSDLHRLCKMVNLAPMDTAIAACRTEMQNAFDRVAEWFRLWQATPSEPFHLVEAVEVSRKSVQLLHSTFEAELTEEGVVQSLPGQYFAGFVDIFFPIFANVAEHSNVESPRALVRIVYSPDAIRVRVENEIGPGVADAGLERIDKLKNAVRVGGDGDPIITEGGTGLHKVRKILAPDPDDASNLDFGYAGDGRFFVEFNLSLDRGLP